MTKIKNKMKTKNKRLHIFKTKWIMVVFSKVLLWEWWFSLPHLFTLSFCSLTVNEEIEGIFVFTIESSELGFTYLSNTKLPEFNIPCLPGIALSVNELLFNSHGD